MVQSLIQISSEYHFSALKWLSLKEIYLLDWQHFHVLSQCDNINSQLNHFLIIF